MQFIDQDGNIILCIECCSPLVYNHQEDGEFSKRCLKCGWKQIYLGGSVHERECRTGAINHTQSKILELVCEGATSGTT